MQFKNKILKQKILKIKVYKEKKIEEKNPKINSHSTPKKFQKYKVG